MTTVISYGGGVQSTALVVLAATGVIDADVALFANTGNDSENPATIAYVRDVATPWATAHGVAIHTLSKQVRGGGSETLMGQLTRSKRSIPIPVRMADTGAPGTRNCTDTFKVKVLRGWLREHAELPADVLIGISTDEVERVNTNRDTKWERRLFPLIGLGVSRHQCKQIIRDAGLPVPPKSACFFCPFHRPQTWREMRRDEPELFAKAQDLEDMLNVRRDELGKDHVYLTRFGRRLSDAVAEAQPALFDVSDLDNATEIGESGCDEGVCFV